MRKRRNLRTQEKKLGLRAPRKWFVHSRDSETPAIGTEEPGKPGKKDELQSTVFICQ